MDGMGLVKVKCCKTAFASPATHKWWTFVLKANLETVCCEAKRQTSVCRCFRLLAELKINTQIYIYIWRIWKQHVSLEMFQKQTLKVLESWSISDLFVCLNFNGLKFPKTGQFNMCHRVYWGPWPGSWFRCVNTRPVTRSFSVSLRSHGFIPCWEAEFDLGDATSPSFCHL